MPNKIFDFIQARLMLITSPVPDLKNFIIENKIGITTENYSVKTLKKLLGSLEPKEINEYKVNSGLLAKSVNSQFEGKKLLHNVRSILAKVNQ
jgi:hypothetical protein